MKNYIALCTALCTLLFATFSFAQDAAWLPIGSKAELAAYAHAMAHKGYSLVYGSDMLWSSSDRTSVNVTGSDSDDVAKKLVSPTESFSFKISDASKADELILHSEITDEAGMTLFVSQIPLVTVPNGTGKLKIDPNAATLYFKLAGTIPLSVPNAYAAEIRYEKPDGTEWTVNLGYNLNGKVWFPSQYAGTGGTLVVTVNGPDGFYQIAYGLATGAAVPGVTITGNHALSVLENHISASDKNLTATQALEASSGLIAPSNSSYEFVAPPTATFTVSKATGMRTCSAIFLTTANVVTDKSEVIEAVATNYGFVAVDGTVEEILASSITVTRTGSSSVIKVTWNLHNYAQDPNGTRWSCYLKIKKYEEQQPPQAPWIGGGQG